MSKRRRPGPARPAAPLSLLIIASVWWNNQVGQMYFQRSNFGVYYTRILLAKSARENGFPRTVRMSLLTKCRKTATERNVFVCGRVLDSLNQQNSFQSREIFDRSLSAFRHALHVFFEGTQDCPPSKDRSLDGPLILTFLGGRSPIPSATLGLMDAR